MGLTDLAGHAVERFVTRLCRRAAGWLAVVIFALAAVYQGIAAALIALELEVGPVRAHLIVAGVFVAVAVAALIALWTTARPSSASPTHAKTAGIEPELQMATIVEAMLLGYSLSRRK